MGGCHIFDKLSGPYCKYVQNCYQGAAESAGQNRCFALVSVLLFMTTLSGTSTGTYKMNKNLQGGELDLTFHIYKLSFLNFLLGKQPNGPGQYLFGTVTPQTPICMFPIDYSAMNASQDDMELFG